MLIIYYTIVGVSIVLLIFWIRSTKRKSKYEFNSSDSSDSEDMLTEQNSSEIIPKSNIDQMLVTDAVYLERRRQGTHSVDFGIPDIRHIEENLDDCEKTSLIFLLSEDPEHCINKVKLSEWASEQILIYPDWSEKLLEALAIIKNFQLPKKFGFSKEELVEEYFPFNKFFTKHISKFRKGLFFICEDFKLEDEKLFIQELRKELRMKNKYLPEFSQMEMYFSYLLKIKYLSPKNTRDCARIVKKLDLEKAFDLFETIEDKTEDDIIPKKMKADSKKLISQSSKNISSDKVLQDEEYISLANSDSTQDNASINRKSVLREPSPHGIYKIAGSKKCFIINQINFYTEVETKYKHLLPPNIEDEMLHKRSGSEVDLHRLKSVFENRNFEVTPKENLSHLKMISELQNMIESIDKKTCSCLFVIILSHGDEGVVYCANSCYVEISTIIEIMSHKKLIHIPKVLILQTCQGPILQNVYDEELTTDGNSSNGADPKSPNFLVFSSTVPGFASIRHKKKGSWFIQALCDQIEKYADKKHFLDICTLVTDTVSTLKWKKDGKYYSMLSYTKTTLKKELYI
ncbi:caspase-8 [Coccinella septempunctata]|uniref:caspase-8 n=1 Tax=Coccinella septempunctata TaxID=41139 RepID=UPI001D0955D5|nr:caspase-8 [Coccinella septempunctata]